MSVWEWLNEPVLSRWFAILLGLWLAFGKPTVPVGRIVARFRKPRTGPRPAPGSFALITSAEGKRHRVGPNPDRQERQP